MTTVKQVYDLAERIKNNMHWTDEKENQRVIVLWNDDAPQELRDWWLTVTYDDN